MWSGQYSSTVHQQAARARRQPDRGVSHWRAVALLAFSVVVLWTGSFPGSPFIGVAAIGIGFLALTTLWVVGLSWRPRPSSARDRTVIVSYLVAAAAIVTSVSGLALTARFAASANAFDAAVQAIPPPRSNADLDHFDSYPGPCPTRIGAFAVSECRTYGGAYLYLQTWNAVSDDAGIAYLPQGPGSDIRYSGFHHLTGHWYSWRLEPMAP